MKFLVDIFNIYFIILPCHLQAIIGMIVSSAMCEAEAEADPVLSQVQEQFLKTYVATGVTDPKTGYVYHVNPLHPNLPVNFDSKDGDDTKLVLPPYPVPRGRFSPFYPSNPCLVYGCRGLPSGPYGPYGPEFGVYPPRQYPVYPGYGPINAPYNPFYQGFVPPKAILAQPTDEE